MANPLLGQPTCHSTGSSGGAPPPPSFAEFKFTTIGQEPELLKRISTPIADSQFREPSSPSPSTLAELQYPSRPVSRSRPSLLQSLTTTDHTDVVMVDMADAIGTTNSHAQQDQCSILLNTRIADRIQAPADRLPSTFRASLPDIPNSSRGPDEIVNLGFASTRAPSSLQRDRSSTSFSSSIPVGTIAGPLTSSGANPHSFTDERGSSIHGADSSYTALRSLQARLLSSLSNLKPPITDDALLLVQTANSHSANALSTAHRSHTLAQQSLASATEAVMAAQECIGAAEQAKAHASDAVAAVEQLRSGTMAGSTEWEWKSTITQLQDDLHALGEWVSERESEEALNRPEADRSARERKHKETIEAAMGATNAGGLDPLVIQAISLEVARKATEAEARMSTAPTRQSAPAPTGNQGRQRSAEVEARAAMRAWSLEHGHPPKHLLITTPDVLQRAPEASVEAPALGGIGEQTWTSLPAAQCDEDNRIREMHEKKLEVAELQMLERERMEAAECSNRSTDESRLKSRRGDGASPAIREVDGPLSRQAQSSAVLEEAKRALEAHKEKKMVLAEQRRLEHDESKKAVVAQHREEVERAEKRRLLLDERKQRELEELKKRQAEKAAELEREAEARELELIAEQARRRQEVMVQKQRASAETAARINAQRAREKEKSTSASSISPGPTASHSLQDHPTEYGNLVAKKTMTSGLSKKPRSISGGVKLGPTIADQTEQTIPDSHPPSPSLTRSAALGLRAKKFPPASLPLPAAQPRAAGTKQKIVPGQDIDESKNLDLTDRVLSCKPPSTTSIVPPLVPHCSMPTNSRDETGDFHVHYRSENSGNMCVVSPSQVPPASPEAQAANLRFVKPNGVPWDHYLKPGPNVGSMKEGSPANEAPSVPKKEEDTSTRPTKSKGRPRIARGKRVDEEPGSPSIPSLKPKIPLPTKPQPLPPVRKAKLPNVQNQQANFVPDQTTTATPMTTAPASRVAIPHRSPVPTASSPTVGFSVSSAPQPAKSTVNLKRPSHSFPSSIRAHTGSSCGDSALTTQTNATLLPSPVPQVPTQPAFENSTTKLNGISKLGESKQHEDHPQIAPIIQDNGGWDRPSTSVDDEGYGTAFRSEEAARLHPDRQRYRRGGDHYSPAPRSLSPPYRRRPLPPTNSPPTGSSRPPRPSPPPPEISPRSPVLLGKRRYREDFRPDEPPSRRRWQPEDERDREEQAYMSRSMWPPPAWRSPSPERPALPARIGVRDYLIGDGQSYRPTYASDTYDNPQSRNHNNYQRVEDPEYALSYGQSAASRTPLVERHKLGRHLVADSRIDRAPSSGRGRAGTSNNANRGGNRGRGGRGGSRPLNLEQRISSQKPLTLMHRLESPPGKY